MPTPPPTFRTPVLLQSLLYLRNPHGRVEKFWQKLGPVFSVPFAGLPPEVYVTTPELAAEIYKLDAGGGRAGAVRRQFLEPVVGEHSLLCTDGDPWMRQRRLLSPPLHGRAIAGYRDAIAAIAADKIASWPLDEPFALRDRLRDITLEVIIQLVFGVRDVRRRERLWTLLPRLIAIGWSVPMMMMSPRLRDRMIGSPLLRRVPFLPTTKLAVLRETVDAILGEEIAHRRREPDPDATDVLSRLLAARDEEGRPMSDREIRDQLITLLEAGHDTVTVALAWTFERLAREPRVLSTLRAELDAGKDDYLEAVIKEVLRFRTVVSEAPRLLDKPISLGGYDVPAGWYVAPLLPAVHRDPDAFPDPDEFRPERFLGEQAARTQKAWMPFGGGRRLCLGAQLAMLELRVVIREVLDRLELRPVTPAPEPAVVERVTLAPALGTRVVATSRARAGTRG